MELPLYQVDAFTDHIFGGNPAAVCPLEHWIDPALMQKIAAENNLAETAFFVKNGDHYEIRWFMPHDEIDLCGHATLASAFVIFNYSAPQSSVVKFNSQSGPLTAKKTEEGNIALDFPSRPPQNIDIPEVILSAFNHRPVAAAANRDLLLLFNSEDEIKTLKVDLSLLKALPYLCIVPTAKGTSVDFVSRVFDANCDIPEDPVTGSAHCSLIPYWQERLGKNTMIAKQLSEREGTLYCTLNQDRVEIAGKARLYLEGKIIVPDLVH